MNIKSVQELEDRTLVFEGEMNPSEVAIVISMGLNTLMGMGMMEMIPGIQSKEIFNPNAGDDDGLIQ